MGSIHNPSVADDLATRPEPRPEIDSDEKGREAVYAVAAWLGAHGYPVSIQKEHTSPFDLLCAGKRIEVKVSPRRPSDNIWFFNIHRHGIMSEGAVDVYILRLENVPDFKYAIHLIIPAPIGKATVQISLRSLITRFGRYYNRFDLLGGKDLSASKQIANGAAYAAGAHA